MNVGIITFHNAENYGAVLQSIALKYAINRLGYRCEIIDYHNNSIDSFYKLGWKSLIKSCLKSPWRLNQHFSELSFIVGRFIRKQAFKKSINKYVRPISLSDFTPKIITFGSDQIWNEKITDSDLTYYGELPDDYTVKRISYAASLGLGNKASLVKNRSLLVDFKEIGVREESLRQMLKDIGLEATLNADPTLLLSADEWDTILNIHHDDSVGQYIFLYAIRDYSQVRAYAECVARENNMKIVEVPSYETFSAKSLRSRHSFSTIRNFIKLLRNSSAVITDSFHGTAFSVIYNKPFISIKLGTKGDDRINSLILRLGCYENFQSIKNLNETIPPAVDLSIYSRLEEFKRDSIEFLKGAIDN